MPTDAEYEDVLEELVRYVEGSGNDISEEIEGSMDDGRPYRGYRCRHGEHIFDVFGIRDEKLEYFVVRYPYDALNAYARRRAIEQRETPIAAGTELDVDHAGSLEHLDELAAKNPESYSNLFAQLRQTLSSPHTSFMVDTTDHGAVTYFHVDRKIFPYEEKFGTSDLSYAVQMVVSNGMGGRILMEDAYGITEAVRRATAGDVGQETTDPDALRYLG
ncbi:MAG: hypothetical protein ABEJ28_00730 [Salinigranum sp.]